MGFRSLPQLFFPPHLPQFFWGTAGVRPRLSQSQRLCESHDGKSLTSSVAKIKNLDFFAVFALSGGPNVLCEVRSRRAALRINMFAIGQLNPLPISPRENIIR